MSKATQTVNAERTEHWVDRLARFMEQVVPDAITTSVLMLVVMVAAALMLGQTVSQTIEAYYRGLWSLLAFTMQMTLILVLSLILGATPVFRAAVIALSHLPRTRVEVMALSVVCVAGVAYLNWGLSIALTPIIAIHFARQAEDKGIAIDFLWIMSVLAGAGAIWQFGLSASAPLLMATPGNFLESTAGVMPLASTIWSPAAIVLVPLFTVAVIVVGCAVTPRRIRQLSEFPDAAAVVDRPAIPEAPSTDTGPAATISERLSRSPLVMVALAIMLGAWLYHHFLVRNASLDINAMNTTVLFFGVVLHGNIASFTRALQQAVALCWPIVLMYHLYAGLAGIIQFTPVGSSLATAFNPILNSYTYPLFTAAVSAIVAIFIPSSGGQWAVQGLVTIETAEIAGVSAQRGLLSLSVGDHMGNLMTPFWAVVGAGIARVDFRLVFGYRLIFAALWFVMGVAAFTFLPC